VPKDALYDVQVDVLFAEQGFRRRGARRPSARPW
jgi:hypothetical protein